MPAKSYPKELSHYHKHLYRYKDSFPCPYSSCNLFIVPKNFEKHCKLFHHLNPNICCVWCKGEKQWILGHKSEHGLHLQTCFKNFIASTITSPSSPHTVATCSTPEPDANHDTTEALLTTTPKLLSMITLCPTQCFFDHPSEYLQNLPRALINDFYPLPVDSSPLLPFQDETLNLATLYVQKYLTTRKHCDWIHIMVKAVSFTSFLEAMEADSGLTQTLSFSCWCDGGKYPQQKHRQHRHLIIVAARGHFQRHVWPYVTSAPEDRPYPQFPCKRMKRILSPLHLVNTLGYLSQRKSRCQFTLDSKKGLRHNKHFYIFKSLPVQYKKVLVTIWEKGVYELLRQEKFQNVSMERMIKHPMIQVGTQWKQKIGDFYHLERGLVLPVQKRFAPTPEPTAHAMHLVNGQKLYFTPDPENEALSEDAWLRKQVAGGNCFYENIGEELWTPRPRDQKCLKTIMKERQRNTELERQNAGLQEDNSRLKEGKTRWKRKCEALEEENKRLNQQRLEWYESEHSRLREENKRLRQTVQRLLTP